MICFLSYSIEGIKIKNKQVIEKNMLIKNVDEPDIEWSKIYGNSDTYESSCDIKETSFGGYIVSGTHLSKDGYTEGWLFKIDKAGNVEWEKKFNMGKSGIWLLTCHLKKEIVEVSDGFLVAATIQKGDDNNPNLPFHCIWLVKIDRQGNELWNKTCYGNSTVPAELISIDATNDGGLVILGVIGSEEFIVIKIDGNGNIEWKRIFNGSEIFMNDIYENGIKTTSDNGFIIHAHSMDSHATCLLKLSDSGYEEWHRSYSHYNEKNVYQDIIQTSDGGYLCCLGIGGIIKIDSLGYEEWRKTYRGDEIYSIAEVNNNGYILTGKIKNLYYGIPNLWILRIDEKGDKLWSKTLGEYEDEVIGKSVKQTIDGGFIVAGTICADGDFDIWIIKLESESSSAYRPFRPSGPSSGEVGVEYEFSTQINHPYGLQVYFGWDWGDGTEIEWTYDIYESGETCTRSHTWYEEKVFKIRVIARDINGRESEWSDYHSISLPRSRINQDNLFLKIIKVLPILQKILFQ